jgi:hypothetical protein
MLPDPSAPDPSEPGAEPFHAHAGILVDDPGHAHDLPALIESVLARVDAPLRLATDVRRWLRRDAFKEHLRRYSRSRRKAPIYWPLATASGSWTLWLYWPALTDQTLYRAVNDCIEPKLKRTAETLRTLRADTARSGADERELARLTDLEAELMDLRTALLDIAPGWKPHHDDGVQITAAPLWPLFRHGPWQRLLKDTWQKLQRGDYDWARLAMHYWPGRVREKCRSDRSLAIAQGLEALYEPPAG